MFIWSNQMKTGNKKIDKIIIFSLCIVFCNLFSILFCGITNKAFSQTEIGTYAQQIDKTSGNQESTQKTTSSFPGFVKGSVFDNVSGLGIADALVSIKNGKTIVAGIKTSGDGAFFLKALPGSYIINVTRNGFLDSDVNITVSAFVTEIRNINMAPTISLPPSSSPSNDPGTECANGGSPESIELFQDLLHVNAGSSERVMVRVKKDKIAGCAINVGVECIAGCEKIELSGNIVATNNLGYAVVDIKTGRRQKGTAVIEFSANNLKLALPVVLVTPAISLPPLDPPPVKGGTECANGGKPVSIGMFPELLHIQAGRTESVRVKVRKDKRAGCPIAVAVECIGGCEKIELSDNKITTNSRGFAVARIKAKLSGKGTAVVLFSVNGLEFVLPVVVDGLDGDKDSEGDKQGKDEKGKDKKGKDKNKKDKNKKGK